MSEETLQLIAEHPYFVELEDRVRRLEEAIKILVEFHFRDKYFLDREKFEELPI